jgi:hypothetical protein
MATLQDLAKKASRARVREIAFKHYQENHQGYNKVQDILANIEPVETEYTIHVDYVEEEFGRPLEDYEKYHHVFAKKEGEPDMTYSLGFSPWAEWAGCTIAKETLKKYKKADIVTHCIYDMTFYGWTEEETQKQAKELQERIDDMERWREEGTLDDHCVTFEELKKELFDEED